ncbi:RagB/SusD family nutrient uptake outer membrane protein [Pedobacter hiemivivus]|uniref:RagB/SusD family nutrient uptake outer membrane protein n=1 Tax=Pedobacter hiemivivus TaxID=2530454 RepID=A0A4V2MGK5_9SPHI|nr:RagB/SusD family nutrient uptake outer membrane protein [Pedobacter hiemivivus]TCC82906.1 RagB/SusD family nutrient uptake outer membrane protein [Pedobacter hiemivivus]
MKRKIIIYSHLVLMVAGLLVTGCVKLDVTPTNKFTDETYWTSEDKANSVLSMAYRQMFSSDYFMANEILSDNVYNGYGTSNEKLIATGLADVSNGRFESEWGATYGGIKTCHTFLANVDRITSMSQLLRDRRKAEIRFIRASLYLELTTWYGDVPHFIADITPEQAKTIARKPQTQILEWVHKELDEVAAILPSREEYAAADNGRITRGAAMALNARAYLYENNWTKVAEYTDKLINSSTYGTYSLFSNYEELFWAKNEYNSEIILSMQYVPELRTWGNLVDFAPMSTNARLNLAGPTQGLVDSYLMKNGKKWTASDPAYAGRDPRMGATIAYDGSKWTNRSGVIYDIVIHPDGPAPTDGRKSDKYTGPGSTQTATGYYYRKFCDPTPSSYTGGGWDSNLNLPLIRFADVLLMYAEAKNELGQMNSTIWDQTIKKLRQRTGFDNTGDALDLPSNDPNVLREVIRNERRCELALEGLRVFDIRRWKTAETVLTQQPRGAKFDKSSGTYDYIKLPAGSFSRNRDYLWAVPRKERLLNPNLSQNPGY